MVNLPNIAGGLNMLFFFSTIANLDTNQDTTLYRIYIYIPKSPKAVLSESLPKVGQKRIIAEKP